MTTASPDLDRVCALWTAWGTGLYRSSPCTSYTDTVCRPASDCARCFTNYDKSASCCLSVDVVAPYKLYSNRSVGSYDHCVWNTSLNGCQPRPAIAQTPLASAFGAFTCASLPQAACSGVSLCRWNILTALYQAIAFSDIYGSTACTEQGACILRQSLKVATSALSCPASFLHTSTMRPNESLFLLQRSKHKCSSRNFSIVPVIFSIGRACLSKPRHL